MFLKSNNVNRSFINCLQITKLLLRKRNMQEKRREATIGESYQWIEGLVGVSWIIIINKLICRHNW